MDIKESKMLPHLLQPPLVMMMMMMVPVSVSAGGELVPSGPIIKILSHLTKHGPRPVQVVHPDRRSMGSTRYRRWLLRVRAFLPSFSRARKEKGSNRLSCPAAWNQTREVDADAASAAAIDIELIIIFPASSTLRSPCRTSGRLLPSADRRVIFSLLDDCNYNPA
ncbi:hypothetical protein ZHAS_00012349 [Anopheles sinensis]|uniref:Uncharacterized protein n=1 Tax=Anopheles sinensis TaxID=74873 RepID=A0A084W280_ANOSI|nr:hypothetical protein ZHAS_00012349 [Anopheles sinensis]